jgi:hypothetical protein
MCERTSETMSGQIAPATKTGSRASWGRMVSCGRLATGLCGSAQMAGGFPTRRRLATCPTFRL